MKNLATHTLTKLEAERWECDQAARERASLDEYSVLLTLKFLIGENRIQDAARVVADYRASKQVQR